MNGPFYIYIYAFSALCCFIFEEHLLHIVWVVLRSTSPVKPSVLKEYHVVFRGACPSRNRTCESVSLSVCESQKSLEQHQKHEITRYGPVWYSMVLYGPVWSPMVLYGPSWSLMVPYGPVWSHMVPYSPILYCMLLYSTVWYHMVPLAPYGTIWHHMVLYDPISSHICLSPYTRLERCSSKPRVIITL